MNKNAFLLCPLGLYCLNQVGIDLPKLENLKMKTFMIDYKIGTCTGLRPVKAETRELAKAEFKKIFPKAKIVRVI